MAVGAGIILRPTGEPFVPIHQNSPTEPAPAAETAKKPVGVLGIHEAGEDPLGLFLKIRRQRDFIVSLHAGILPEGLLEGT
jgi:hypothetical protein